MQIVAQPNVQIRIALWEDFLLIKYPPSRSIPFHSEFLLQNIF